MTVVLASGLFLADSFVLNQGFISVLVALVALLVLVPRALLSSRTEGSLRRKRLVNAGIYLLAVLFVFSANAIQNCIADRRAVMLGKACIAFRAKYDHYPQRLEELVPEFIPSVPDAKTLSGTSFIYIPKLNGGEPMLFYEAVPPFGRRFYHVESRSWGFLD